jgi:hypothetical protein
MSLTEIRKFKICFVIILIVTFAIGLVDVDDDDAVVFNPSKCKSIGKYVQISQGAAAENTGLRCKTVTRIVQAKLLVEHTQPFHNLSICEEHCTTEEAYLTSHSNRAPPRTIPS